MSGAEIFTRLRLLLYSTLTTTMTMGRGRGLSRNLPGAGKVKHDRRRQPWPQQTKNLLQLLSRHKSPGGSWFLAIHTNSHAYSLYASKTSEKLCSRRFRTGTNKLDPVGYEWQVYLCCLQCVTSVLTANLTWTAGRSITFNKIIYLHITPLVDQVPDRLQVRSTPGNVGLCI